jgi:hypothetical protein
MSDKKWAMDSIRNLLDESDISPERRARVECIAEQILDKDLEVLGNCARRATEVVLHTANYMREHPKRSATTTSGGCASRADDNRPRRSHPALRPTGRLLDRSGVGLTVVGRIVGAKRLSARQPERHPLPCLGLIRLRQT